MASVSGNSIWFFSLILAIAWTHPARAADVTVQLDTGAGFSIRDNTGAIERRG